MPPRSSSIWPRGLRRFAFAAAVAASGCFAAPLESTDAHYRAGIASFEAERWAQSRDELRAFLGARCAPAAEVGCQKALWALLLGDLMAGRPDLALVDASVAPDVGPPRPELDPPVAALRERASGELGAAWAASARPSRIAVFHRDETAARYRVVHVTCSVDERESIDIPVGQWASEHVVISLPAPAGVHVLALASTYESAPGAAAPYKFTVRSVHPFATRADETTNLIVTTHDRAPTAAGVASRIAVSFVAVPGPRGP